MAATPQPRGGHGLEPAARGPAGREGGRPCARIRTLVARRPVRCVLAPRLPITHTTLLPASGSPPLAPGPPFSSATRAPFWLFWPQTSPTSIRGPSCRPWSPPPPAPRLPSERQLREASGCTYLPPPPAPPPARSPPSHPAGTCRARAARAAFESVLSFFLIVVV